MNAAALPSAASLADLSGRLEQLLAALLKVVGNRSYLVPGLQEPVVPFRKRIARDTRRLQRLLARLAAGKLPTSRQCKPRGPRKAPYRKPVLPTARGWLGQAGGYDARGIGSQLEYLLSEPDAAALLAIPAFARIINPFRHMLGNPPRPPKPPAPPKPERERPAQDRRPTTALPAAYRKRLARIPARHRPVVERALRRLLPDPAPD